MGLVVLIAAVGLEGASSGVEVNVVAVAGLALIDEDDLSNAVGGPGIDGPEAHLSAVNSAVSDVVGNVLKAGVDLILIHVHELGVLVHNVGLPLAVM